MKVFISSVITGFEPFRAAAAEAIRVLGHEVIRAEDFAAVAATPQQTCLAGVRESDLVVVLLGERYGHRQASGKSATHEEFDEAIRSKPVIAFDQTGIDRDDDMGTFVVQVQEWAGGSLTTSFSTPEELRDRVTRALADHAVRDQAGRIDDEEILGRAMDLVPADRNQGSDVLVVAIAAGPSQQVLRPGEIEGGELCRELKREAMFGAAPVLDSNLGARCQVRGDLLSVTNDAEVLILDPLGSVATFRPARRRRDTITGLNPLIEEDVAEAIEGALRFAGIVLKMVDPTERLTAVAPLAAVLGSPLGWRTRAEQAASPNSMSVGSGTRCNEGAVRLSPITRPRRQLTLKSSELAEDLTVLLRRQMKS